MTIDDAARRLADWAKKQPTAVTCIALPEWPEDDPRWKVPYRTDYSAIVAIDAAAERAKALLLDDYRQRISDLLDSDQVMRIHVVNALGTTFAKLDSFLAGDGDV